MSGDKCNKRCIIIGIINAITDYKENPKESPDKVFEIKEFTKKPDGRSIKQ